MKLEPGLPYLFNDSEDGKSLLLLTEDGNGFYRYILKETIYPTATKEDINSAIEVIKELWQGQVGKSTLPT